MNEVMIREEGSTELSVSAVAQQVQKIQELMRSLMKDGEHYGKIPGTNKPTLLKAGAEKLGFMFRLAPHFEITRHDLKDGHREYEVVCSVTNIQTGAVVGEGVGNCSTMETKYRYRNVADFEITDDPIPQDTKERKQEYRKQGYGMKMVNGAWYWVRYKDSERQENPDIADTYNTVLKMAKKRAHVDAMITSCAASDIFTQDVEDFVEPVRQEKPPEGPPAQKVVVPEEVQAKYNSMIEDMKRLEGEKKLTHAIAKIFQGRMNNAVMQINAMGELEKIHTEIRAKDGFKDDDLDQFFDDKKQKNVTPVQEDIF